MRIGAFIPVSKPDAVRPKSVRGTGPVAEGAGDTAEFSASAAHIQVAREAIEAAPEVREERVAELREQIQNEQFPVTEQDVADKLLSARRPRR